MVDTTVPAAGSAPANLQPGDYAPAAAGAAPAPAFRLGDAAPDATGPAPDADPYAGQIAQWKKQHREVTEITVRDADGALIRCFMHNPDRNVIAQALTQIMNKRVLEAGEFLLMNCWLGGDERCNPNNPQAYDPFVVAASKEAAGCIELLSADSKKL